MAASKTVKTLAGTKRRPTSSKHPVIPVNTGELAAAVDQLQATVNELITRVNALVSDFNTHVHSGVTAGGANSGAKTSAATTAVAGSVVADTNLFTP